MLGACAAGLTPIKNSVLNVKAVLGAFNKDKALVGAFADLRFQL